jgi:isopenicillin-N N-acyltransferase-like protein
VTAEVPVGGATPPAGLLARTLDGYDALFAASGIGPDAVRAVADSTRIALLDWAPDLVDELDRIAAGAGQPPWRLFALNARTEVLATAPSQDSRECSALAAPGLGGQTWDWHVELADCWQVRATAVAGRINFVTLTEAGILAKIGVNAAGVGVLFNILGHRSDTGLGGVPVHAVARRVLDSAGDVESALAIIADAPLAASSCFTVLDADRTACVEASAAGIARVPAEAGWTVHTNHFLDPGLAADDLRLGPESDSEPRLTLLRDRLAGRPPGSADQLRELLCAHESDGAPVCCHAPATGQLGSRWQSLATVAVLPAERSLRVLSGGPCGPAGWTVHHPPAGAG